MVIVEYGHNGEDILYRWIQWIKKGKTGKAGQI
jgi:hypothetical protein